MKGKLEMVIVVIGLVMCSGVLMTASSPMMMGYGSAYVQDMPEGSELEGGDLEYPSVPRDPDEYEGYNGFWVDFAFECVGYPAMRPCILYNQLDDPCRGNCNAGTCRGPTEDTTCQPPPQTLLRFCSWMPFHDCNSFSSSNVDCGGKWEVRCMVNQPCVTYVCYNLLVEYTKRIGDCLDRPHQCDYD